MKKAEVKLFIAVGIASQALVLVKDGERDAEGRDLLDREFNVSEKGVDLNGGGLATPKEPGFYIWEGTLDATDRAQLVWNGKFQRVEAEYQLRALFFDFALTPVNVAAE